VLREQHQFLVGGRRGRGNGTGALGRSRLSHQVAVHARCKNLFQQPGQFTPFPVFTAPPQDQRQRLQAFQRANFPVQLRNRSRGGGLVENLLLGGLDLVVGGVLQILHVFFV